MRTSMHCYRARPARARSSFRRVPFHAAACAMNGFDLGRAHDSHSQRPRKSSAAAMIDAGIIDPSPLRRSAALRRRQLNLAL